MPGTNELDEELEEGTEESEETTEGTEESEETTEDPPKADKRISDLQSKADRETARANKAEAALKALNAGKGGVPGSNPETEALMQELREASLDAVYGEYPDLKKFGIERSLIEGSTRAEMREAAASVVKLIGSLSTKVRNEVLSEHGIKAEPTGAARKPPVRYDDMSDEDFIKLLDAM